MMNSTSTSMKASWENCWQLEPDGWDWGWQPFFLQYSSTGPFVFVAVIEIFNWSQLVAHALR